LKTLKKETFKVPVASVPDVMSTMNRNIILDTKKNNEGVPVILTVVEFTAHKLQNIRGEIKVIVSPI
jgi:hypothetical protein